MTEIDNATRTKIDILYKQLQEHKKGQTAKTVSDEQTVGSNTVGSNTVRYKAEPNVTENNGSAQHEFGIDDHQPNFDPLSDPNTPFAKLTERVATLEKQKRNQTENTKDRYIDKPGLVIEVKPRTNVFIDDATVDEKAPADGPFTVKQITKKNGDFVDENELIMILSKKDNTEVKILAPKHAIIDKIKVGINSQVDTDAILFTYIPSDNIKTNP
jgi:acetyl/propionyl-CoA carboxylase alpha subunit